MSEDRSVFELTAEPSKTLLRYGEGADQVIEVFRAIGAVKKRVLLVHGGYWRPEFDRSHLRPYAQELALRGIETFLLEYRRELGSPENYLDDLISALKVIGPCSVIGHSAGGHLALLVESLEQVESVIALAPVSDLVAVDELGLDDGVIRLFLGAPPSEYPHLNPMSMNGYSSKVTVIHGDQDHRVPVELSRKFVERFTDVAYIELAEVGHFELIDPRRDNIVDLVVGLVLASL